MEMAAGGHTEDPAIPEMAIVEHSLQLNRPDKYWWQILPVPNSLRHLPAQGDMCA